MKCVIIADEKEIELIRKAQAEYAREWGKRNPGKKAEYSKRWRESHPEQYAESRRRYWLKKATAMQGHSNGEEGEKNG